MAKLEDRRWSCDVPGTVLTGIQAGVFRTRYRDRAFVKCPFDVVLYMQLIGRLKPATIIEIGTREGGSAQWFRDMSMAHGVDARVISVDVKPPEATGDGRVTFLKGNAIALGESLPDDLLRSLPRPWLISEDSAHTYEACSAVLNYFDSYLTSGDYIVIEDGVIEFLPGEGYKRLENGPNRAVTAFLAERGADYDIDSALCDHFGYNVTYNPNAWLRRL